MNRLHRISVWGLVAGWLILAFAAKAFRGDAEGMWILVNPVLVIGLAVLLVSTIGAFISTFTRPHRPE